MTGKGGATMAEMDNTNPLAPPLDVDAVLFDLDGTVVNTIPHILASFRHATGEVLGVVPSEAELLRHIGIPLAHQMRTFTRDEDVVERLLDAYRQFNRATHDEMAQVYPNSRATLARIHHAGLPIGIVTSKSRPMAERAITLFDLGEYITALVTLEDTPNHKPDPMPVLHGAALLGVEPARCVYVGDAPTDITAGKRAGAATVGATWGVADRARLVEAEPDAIIDDMSELPALLGIEAQQRR